MHIPKIGQVREAGGAPPEDARLCMDAVEHLAMVVDVFRWPEQQETAGIQGEMQQWHDALLQLGVQIDQQVSARDETELRERRVLDDIVHRENAELANVLTDPIAAALAREESLEPLRGDVP